MTQASRHSSTCRHTLPGTQVPAAAAVVSTLDQPSVTASRCPSASSAAAGVRPHTGVRDSPGIGNLV
eukprot:3938316-Rhodomonas_salina.1